MRSRNAFRWSGRWQRSISILKNANHESCADLHVISRFSAIISMMVTTLVTQDACSAAIITARSGGSGD